MPALSNFNPLIKLAENDNSRWARKQTYICSFAHNLRSLSNIVDPVLHRVKTQIESIPQLLDKMTNHPTTAVQYTSGVAKIKSSRLCRRRRDCNISEDGGRMKTVNAFS